LEGFKQGHFRVLVATDIAARGIDVEALDHVVNFDVPADAKDYIHRVGRTARADATGEAFTLIAPEEEPLARGIERALAREVERRTLAGFDYAASAQTLELPAARRFPRSPHFPAVGDGRRPSTGSRWSSRRGQRGR
jgi:ATP-dependent RNA helicase RhlE